MADAPPLRVLVCGGRDFGEVPMGVPAEECAVAARMAAGERGLLFHTLDSLRRRRAIAAIIHGAARGADDNAGYWARLRKVAEERYPADWKAHGRPAGAIRNSNMLERSRPDLVIAFSGGRGTADMVAKARRAGVLVVVVEDAPPMWEDLI